MQIGSLHAPKKVFIKIWTGARQGLLSIYGDAATFMEGNQTQALQPIKRDAFQIGNTY